MVTCLVAFALLAPPKPAPSPGPTMKLNEFYFNLLVSPKQPPAMTAEAQQQLMKDHLAFLEAGWKRGDYLAVGPLGPNRSNWAGVILTRSDDVAVKGFQEEPTVRAGMNKLVTLKWWSSPDSIGKAEKFMELETYWLAILRRPKNAPKLSPEEGERQQKLHIANIEAMARAGRCFAAGPFDGAGDIRGLFVLKHDREEKVREWFKPDPFISGGILEVELIPWSVSKGIFRRLKV